MEEKFSYGLASANVGDTDPVTGLGTNMVDLGKVLKDTIELIETDSTPTPIYAQQNTGDPALIIEVGTGDVVKASLMNTSAANLAKFCGGKVVSLNGVDTWHKPTLPVPIIMAFEFVTTDGAKIEIPRAQVRGKRVLRMVETGIWVIELTITALASKVTGVDSVMISDPIAE